MILSVIGISIIYKNKGVNNITKVKNKSNLAIMVMEEGATEYTRLSSKDIPKGNYTLNREKSYCKNNGVIGDYDNTLGKVSFSFIGTDSCYLYFDYLESGYVTILNNNGGATAIEAKGTPDFSSVSTTNEGMYAATDDLGTSYYFRGAVNNNWVKFGKDSSGNDIYWRIIRINGDGSIRMIYSGTTAPTSSTATVMTGTGTQIGTIAFNSSLNYALYMYTEGDINDNSTSSTIKTAIDNWYTMTTLYTDNEIKSLVADQIFCNDRSGNINYESAERAGTSYYADFDILTRVGVNNQPILTCSAASDKFTVNASNGNGALDYPVGLITADEVAMAGGLYTSNNLDNDLQYLFTNQAFWIGSPYDFVYNGDSDASFEVTAFYVSIAGNILYASANNIYGVRPVISLSSNAKLSGNGTYDDVYTVH